MTPKIVLLVHLYYLCKVKKQVVMHIHILSPSGYIPSDNIDQASNRLESYGHIVSIASHAKGKYGRFSGTEEERIQDLQNAINDPFIDAILCSRGGYGLVQIIDKIDITPLLTHPKLLIGFSDITVIHNALAKYDIPSLHAIMTKHIATASEEDEAFKRLINILNNPSALPSPVCTSSHPLNRFGESCGMLRGGNLSVLYGLRNTPFDIPEEEDTILFIEDIAERPYHIDRMINNLRLSGVLKRLHGLIIGQFSECTEDPLMMSSIAERIAYAVSDYNYPVCFNFPAGHVDHNLPLLLNSHVNLCVADTNVVLSYK